MTKRRPAEYFSKGIPTIIKATSRVSVKITESFYTFEFQEERTFPANLVEDGKVDFEKEKEMLWDEVHSQVDKQVSDIVSMLKSRK